MTDMVPVHYFPKRCTSCATPLAVIVVWLGHGGWWYECRTCRTKPS